MDPSQLLGGVEELGQYAQVIRAAALVFIVLVVVLAVRTMMRRSATSAERALEKALQEALGRGDLLRAGDVQMRRGRYLEASRIFERAGDFVRSGRALLKGGDQKAAATAFEKGSDFGAAAPLLRNAGEHLRAAECFLKSGTPEHKRAAAECFVLGGEYLRGAQIFEKIGDLERAADALARASKLDAPDPVLTMLENAALSAGPAEKPGLWFKVAEEAKRLGYYERAAVAFERADARAKAAELYEEPLKRFDVAAAIYEELGNTAAAARPTIAAGGEVPVLKQRVARAREQGNASLVQTLEARLAQLGHGPAPAVVTPPVVTPAATPPGPQSGTPTTVDSTGPGRGRAEDAATETRFEMLGELGRGGMGVVHKARDRRLGRLVALKFLPAEIAPDSPLVSTFRREARAAAALSHPGIVTVYDVGVMDGRDYIAMELVDGTTLEKVLEDGGPLRPLEALETMERVLEAVECAHQKAIIHRDLKPSNIMRTKTGVKVMDFGLAKIVGASKTSKHTLIGGTPAYMPPEQLTGTADPRSDVFALGAVFYELLTNTVPGTPDKTASMSTGYPTPSQRVPAVPPRLSELIMRCLEHDRALRPRDATAMLTEVREIRAALQATMDELRAFVEAPIESTPPPARAREQRPAERRPVSAPVSGPASRRAPIPREDD